MVVVYATSVGHDIQMICIITELRTNEPRNIATH